MYVKILVFFIVISTSLIGNQKIVVIGAGLSGLTAAYRLLEKGYDVDVYEARNRVGGRVLSVMVDGHVAELGGQNLLDGGEATSILSLIHELGLETEEKSSSLNFFYYDGDIIDFGELLKHYDFNPQNLKSKLESIKQTAKNMEEVLQALFDKQETIYKACCVQLAGYEGASVDKLSPLCIDTLYHLLLGGLSTIHPNCGDSISTEMYVKGGNSLIAERLSEKFSGYLYLNHVLRAISKNSEGAYILKFQDGTEITAEILILTIPCSVYKDIDMTDDVIPIKRKWEIENMLYGTTTKILVPLMNQVKDETVVNDQVIAFTNGDDYVVNLYYTGQSGFFTQETIIETFQKDLPLIEKVYGIPFSKQPCVAFDKPFYNYLGPVGHNWNQDPFAKGSYSCAGVGKEEIFTSNIEIAGETIRTLFVPIGSTLFFVGEHTTPFYDIGGSMEAAVESGERAARLVAKILN